MQMHILQFVDISGTILGVGWFLYWLLFKQRSILFFRGMSWQRIKAFFRELGTCYVSKLFGRVGGVFIAGETLAIEGRAAGQIAARYGTAGIGADLFSKGLHNPAAPWVAFGILVCLSLVEILYFIHKDRRIIESWARMGKLLLETYAIFGIVGFMTSFVLGF